MLTLREKLIVLYATAPAGFEASRKELMGKFRENKRKTNSVLERLVAKGVLTCKGDGRRQAFVAGPALCEELGTDG